MHDDLRWRWSVATLFTASVLIGLGSVLIGLANGGVLGQGSALMGQYLYVVSGLHLSTSPPV